MTLALQQAIFCVLCAVLYLDSDPAGGQVNPGKGSSVTTLQSRKERGRGGEEGREGKQMLKSCTPKATDLANDRVQPSCFEEDFVLRDKTVTAEMKGLCRGDSHDTRVEDFLKDGEGKEKEAWEEKVVGWRQVMW